MSLSVSVRPALLLLLLATAPLAAASFLHKPLSDWRRDLAKSDRPALRRSAAFAIGRIGPVAAFAVDDLARALRRDPDESVREMAASAIGDLVSAISAYVPQPEWDKAGNSLLHALSHDPSPRVRRSAAYAIGAFGVVAQQAAPALRQALHQEEPSLRQNAAWALGRVATDTKAVPDLCESLQDKHPSVRRDAALALGQLGQRVGRENLATATQALFQLTKKESDEVVLKTILAALTSLAEEKHRQQAASLYPILQNKDLELARLAAFVLANLGGPPARQALPVLRQALADPDASVQAAAAACLANAAAEAAQAVEELAHLLTLPRPAEVRRNCAIALSRISREASPSSTGPVSSTREDVARLALPGLIQALKPHSRPSDLPDQTHAEEEVREYVVEAIAQIGYPHNEKALPALREILAKQGNPSTRQRAVWALFNYQEKDLKRLGMMPVLLAVLEEKEERALLVRYDVARVLAWALREHAPDKVRDVLLDMLQRRGLRVFHGSGALLQGIPEEGKSLTSKTTASQGGDARYMAAKALSWLGEKARRDKTILQALEKASRDPEPSLQRAAEEALSDLKKNGA